MPPPSTKKPVITKQTATTRSQTPISKQTDPEFVGDVWGSIDTIRMLLYGESGSGKTCFWATFPGPILAIICSGGNKPGELRSINKPEFRKKITPRVVNTSDEFRQALEEAEGYATTVLDHSTGFADLLLREILGVPEIPLAKYKKAGKGESWSTVTQQQYGELALKCKEAFRDLLNLPGNIVLVAQQRTFGVSEDGKASEDIRPTVGAALTPSVTGWLNPACDYVVQMFKRPKTEEKTMVGVTRKVKTGGVEYCLRTEPHDVFMTKFRLPVGHPLPPYIVNPSYEKMMAVINGESPE